MTKSEQICNDIGKKFFCKDYVYENLKYHNKTGNRVELCDGLFAFGDLYVVLQIKERSSSNGKSDKDWLRDVVYKEAVEQVVETVFAIKSNKISVNDCYHQPVQLNSDNNIFPIVVFDNPSITDYQKIYQKDGIDINIFRIDDYQKMMEVLIHPYDIIYYLQERFCWINKANGTIPMFVVGDGEKSAIISRIRCEGDFARFFSKYIYDGDQEARDDSLRVLAIIDKFHDNQIKKNKEYKTILNILQMIRPEIASGFIKRFQLAWDNSCKNIMDYSKAIQLLVDSKKISIVFFSVGTSPLEEIGIYEMICDAKQQQQKADVVLLISFLGSSDNNCQIDWIYYEKPFVEDPELLNEYIKNGILPDIKELGNSLI